MKKYISLHGSYYPNNYGDVLILAIQAKWIKEITGREVVLPYATDIYRDTIKPVAIKGLKGIKESDKLVYGAGGYLGEPLTNKWKWGFRFFTKHVLPAECANIRKVSYAVVGTGVGPITNTFTRYEVKRICKHANMVVVRDDESKIFLVHYGIPEERIKVTVDVALSLTKEDLPVESVNNIKALFAYTNGLKYGIHVGVDINSSTYGGQAQVLLEDCIRFLNENMHITPVLIMDNDNEAQNNAIQFLKNRLIHKCIIFKHKYIWDTTALLSELDLVLTNKLHIGIVSYALGSIPIGFPYHPKTKRFYKQIEQENLCTSVLDIKPNTVYSVLNDSLREEWVNRVNEKRESIRPILMKKSLMNKKYLEVFLLG